MNDLFSKTTADIRYVENFNGTVILRKSDFECLINRLKQYEDAEKEIQKEILSCYGLPPELLQDESPLKASIETQLKIFEGMLRKRECEE